MSEPRAPLLVDNEVLENLAPPPVGSAALEQFSQEIYKSVPILQPIKQSDDSSSSSPQAHVNITSEWIIKTTITGEKSYMRVSDGTIWYEAKSSDGRTYFYNVATNESAWHLPSSSSSNAAPVAAAANTQQLCNDSFSSDEEPPECEVPNPLSEDEYVATQRMRPNLKTSIAMNRMSLAENSIPHMHTVDIRRNETTVSKRFSKGEDASLMKKGEAADFRKSFLSGSAKSTGESGEAAAMTGTGAFHYKKITKDQISAPFENKIVMAKRVGQMIRTKYSENNRLCSKKWTQGYMMIQGPQLYIYRDSRSLPKAENDCGKPEITMQVRDIVCSKANSNHTSKPYVLLLRDIGAPGSEVEYLVGLPNNDELLGWEAALKMSQSWDKEKKYCLRRSITFQKKVDSNLVSSLFDKLMKRPSREDLERRGLIKTRPVFGANLVRLCEMEQSLIPSFVSRVIHAIELRGLDFEGLYRTNVPDSRVQALRVMVDQGQYNLNSENLDMQCLSSALKLFLRELESEGLITQRAYSQMLPVITDTQMPQDQKIARVKALLESMPPAHLETARVIFHHFHRVMEEPASKMGSKALASVIGPNIVTSILGHSIQKQMADQNILTHFLMQNIRELFGDPQKAPHVMPLH